MKLKNYCTSVIVFQLCCSVVWYYVCSCVSVSGGQLCWAFAIFHIHFVTLVFNCTHWRIKWWWWWWWCRYTWHLPYADWTQSWTPVTTEFWCAAQWAAAYRARVPSWSPRRQDSLPPRPLLATLAVRSPGAYSDSHLPPVTSACRRISTRCRTLRSAQWYSIVMLRTTVSVELIYATNAVCPSVKLRSNTTRIHNYLSLNDGKTCKIQI